MTVYVVAVPLRPFGCAQGKLSFAQGRAATAKRLWHKGIFVMFYLYGPGLTEHERNNIKTKRLVLNIVNCEKMTGGSAQFGSFSKRDDRLGWLETFIRSGFYLNEDDRAVGSDHNQIDFAAPTREVASELSETFSYKIPLAAFFTPSAEQFRIGQ